MGWLAGKRLFAVVALLLGTGVGVGMVTFTYARGLSYFSSDPRACINCHIMNDQYDSWNKSSHHAAAKCVDCHLPHNGVDKWIAKAENGYHHSKGFTFQDFHEPIMIKQRNSDILQNNCLKCHADLVHDIVQGSTSDVTSVSCVHCHASVGHGPTR